MSAPTDCSGNHCLVSVFVRGHAKVSLSTLDLHHHRGRSGYSLRKCLRLFTREIATIPLDANRLGVCTGLLRGLWLIKRIRL